MREPATRWRHRIVVNPFSRVGTCGFSCDGRESCLNVVERLCSLRTSASLLFLRGDLIVPLIHAALTKPT